MKRDIKILNTASYIPHYVVSNQQLSEFMNTSDEWIRTRTGIKSRHISLGENTSDLAFKVAQQLLVKANVDPEKLDLIIVATMSPDAYTPSTAAIVQGQLGAKNAVAFDISAACSGFVYAFNTAEMMMKNSDWQYALVIGAEVLSKLVDWQDRTTAVLFGDGAGGCLLQKVNTDEKLVLGKDWQTYGELSNKITAGNTKSGTAFPKEVASIDPFTMAGREVYRFATHEVPQSIINAAQQANLSLNEIDCFLLHQANKRIIEQIAKRFDQPLAKFPIDIGEYGNIAAASEPVLLAECIKNGTIKRGDIIALSGFGGGLSTGTTILKY